MRKFWQMEFPVGDANRGPAFAECLDPATLGTVAAIGSVLGGAATVAGVLGGKKTPAAPPPLSAPAKMPEPDDAAVRAAKRRSIAAQSQRQGRDSTVLSDPLAGTDILGG